MERKAGEGEVERRVEYRERERDVTITGKKTREVGHHHKDTKKIPPNCFKSMVQGIFNCCKPFL